MKQGQKQKPIQKRKVPEEKLKDKTIIGELLIFHLSWGNGPQLHAHIKILGHWRGKSLLKSTIHT